MAETFSSELERWSWDQVGERILGKTSGEVETALSRPGACTLEDFMALVSPAGASYLEEMAHASRELTLRRFGNGIQMFVPMYLSNECTNVCDYCGFSLTNKIPRKNPCGILVRSLWDPCWTFVGFVLAPGRKIFPEIFCPGYLSMA